MREKYFDKLYLSMALLLASGSRAKKLKVGCLIVKDRCIIADGFNGTPTGFDNVCEHPSGKTKIEVLHAEANAILKIATSTNSSEGATIYITVPPCENCAKLIIQAKIKKLVYEMDYKNDLGLQLLKKAGIKILKISTR